MRGSPGDRLRRLMFDLVDRGVGGRTVAELERRMGAGELLEWQALAEVRHAESERDQQRRGGGRP